MPRPKKTRIVSSHPEIAAFVPQDMPITGELMLSVEELEAIRLSDVERLDQESAANLMQVSRQTYGRILAAARGIVGQALVSGKALKITGGHYAMRGGGHQRRRRCGRGLRRKME
ncbi:MAG: DNA-binding protein [Proteobacteria bacterium]|nr:MAG: DNA-binding protein [Pseudomonadota bacterium]